MKGKKKPRRMFKGERARESDSLRAQVVKLPKGKYGVAILGDTTGFRYSKTGSGKMVGPYPGEEYRYPLRDGGYMTIRPEGGRWVCIHPSLGMIGEGCAKEIAMLMAEAFAETLPRS
jgi:hypothetical protein